MHLRTFPAIIWCLWLAIAVDCLADGPTADEVLANMRPYDGPSAAGVDTTTLEGKVLCGYQGWFTAEGDGSQRGWFHYGVRGGFEPGRCSIDLWPDVSELDADERYPTAFRHVDGSVASVFSSMNRKTVVRHFKWMEDYGIDGAFVQRFTPKLSGPAHLNHTTTVLAHCREGANRHGRCYAVMYDMHFDAKAIGQMMDDWRRLVDRMRITADPAYLHHRGRPVISLWGIGFKHRRFDAEAAKRLIEFLGQDPKYGRLTIMLGVPAYWRTLSRDCRDDATLHEIMRMADVVSPWSVGRFALLEDVAHHADIRLKGDVEWCRRHEKDYLPVVFPGFSWHNMNADSPVGQIPRHKGQFLWRQYVEARRVGATMIYQAMFDEIDEGTAIFKCTNDPPAGESPFLTYEGLPSDHYLWLTGMGGRLIRGEIEPGELLPPRDSREFFPTIRVNAAGVESPLGNLVTDGLCDYFRRMFINPVEKSDDGGRFDLVIGTPDANPLIKQAVQQERIRLPQGKYAGRAYTVKNVDGTIYLAARSEQWLPYAVYRLLDAYGAYFKLSGERLPSKREFVPKPLHKKGDITDIGGK